MGLSESMSIKQLEQEIAIRKEAAKLGIDNKELEFVRKRASNLGIDKQGLSLKEMSDLVDIQKSSKDPTKKSNIIIEKLKSDDAISVDDDNNNEEELKQKRIESIIEEMKKLKAADLKKEAQKLGIKDIPKFKDSKVTDAT